MDTRILPALAFGLSGSLGIAGCSNMPGSGADAATVMDYDATLRARGEAVFRLQNRVMDEFIEAAAFETELPAAEVTALNAAERRLIRDCRDLNEAAAVRARGDEPDLLLKLRVFDALDRCERSAQAAQEVLHNGAVHGRGGTP